MYKDYVQQSWWYLHLIHHHAWVTNMMEVPLEASIDQTLTFFGEAWALEPPQGILQGHRNELLRLWFTAAMWASHGMPRRTGWACFPGGRLFCIDLCCGFYIILTDIDSKLVICVFFEMVSLQLCCELRSKLARAITIVKLSGLPPKCDKKLAEL